LAGLFEADARKRARAMGNAGSVRVRRAG